MDKKRWVYVGLIFLSFVSWLNGTPIDQERPARPQPRDFTAHLIGHAHIDLAWLWQWEETVRDIAVHTFRGTLAHMEKMQGLTFAQNQPALYEAIERYDPGLFQEISKKVGEGTWIPVGGMWVEPDLNMPDGESLARQLLYGKRYFQEKFGRDVTVGWNPDSFGHSFQLPQILSKAGIKFYVFERCEPGAGPVFWWEGADGSRVLAYVPPGWYLVDLRNGVRDLIEEVSKTTSLKDFMLLYGEGDYGGGPRRTDLEAILRFRDDPEHPRLAFADPEDYFEKLEASGVEFPVVKKELNFTFPASGLSSSGWLNRARCRTTKQGFLCQRPAWRTNSSARNQDHQGSGGGKNRINVNSTFPTARSSSPSPGYCAYSSSTIGSCSGISVPAPSAR